jgi:hypothetical protein
MFTAIEKQPHADTAAAAPTRLLLTVDGVDHLIQVDVREYGKVWVFGYLADQQRWFYQSLNETDCIRRAPENADFPTPMLPIDEELLNRMRGNHRYPERDNGAFVRPDYRGQQRVILGGGQ